MASLPEVVDHRRVARFTQSSAHRMVTNPDKYHLALAFSSLRLRREYLQLEFDVEANISFTPPGVSPMA